MYVWISVCVWGRGGVQWGVLCVFHDPLAIFRLVGRAHKGWNPEYIFPPFHPDLLPYSLKSISIKRVVNGDASFTKEKKFFFTPNTQESGIVTWRAGVLGLQGQDWLLSVCILGIWGERVV